MTEPRAELESGNRPLSIIELEETLDQIDNGMVASLVNHKAALNIFQFEHSPEDQLAESVKTKDAPSKKFPRGREWVCAVSFTRGELAVKSFPSDNPLDQEGFFIYEYPKTLEYRRMDSGIQIKYSNSSLAAQSALKLVGLIEARIRPKSVSESFSG